MGDVCWPGCRIACYKHWKFTLTISFWFLYHHAWLFAVKAVNHFVNNIWEEIIIWHGWAHWRHPYPNFLIPPAHSWGRVMLHFSDGMGKTLNFFLVVKRNCQLNLPDPLWSSCSIIPIGRSSLKNLSIVYHLFGTPTDGLFHNLDIDKPMSKALFKATQTQELLGEVLHFDGGTWQILATWL